MKFMQNIPILTFFIMLSAGCVVKDADFAIVGTKNVNINMQEFEKIGENVTGESTGRIIIIFPLKKPTINEAIQDALQGLDGEFMTDAVLYRKFLMLPPFYSQFSYLIKGNVWRLKNKAGVHFK